MGTFYYGHGHQNWTGNTSKDVFWQRKTLGHNFLSNCDFLPFLCFCTPNFLGSFFGGVVAQVTKVNFFSSSSNPHRMPNSHSIWTVKSSLESTELVLSIERKNFFQKQALVV
jgi:hypothetical protein